MIFLIFLLVDIIVGALFSFKLLSLRALITLSFIQCHLFLHDNHPMTSRLNSSKSSKWTQTFNGVTKIYERIQTYLRLYTFFFKTTYSRYENFESRICNQLNDQSSGDEILLCLYILWPLVPSNNEKMFGQRNQFLVKMEWQQTDSYTSMDEGVCPQEATKHEAQYDNEFSISHKYLILYSLI